VAPLPDVGVEMNVVLTPATIAKLELGEGDVVVVRSNANFSAEDANRIGKTVKEAVGDHKVLVLTPSLSIEVLSKPGP
jgi:hypothetical protein